MTITIENRTVDAVIVDHDMMTMSALSDMLTSLGVKTECVDPSETSLLLIARMKPKVAVVHMGKDRREGIGFSRRMRETPETRDIPIVMFSGADESDIDEAVSEIKTAEGNGAVVGLQKPVKIAHLKTVLVSLIHPSSARDEVKETP